MYNKMRDTQLGDNPFHELKKKFLSAVYTYIVILVSYMIKVEVMQNCNHTVIKRL